MQASRVTADGPVGGELEEDPILYDEELLEELASSKLERLRSLVPFVLDNSLRETSVAAVRGHTLQDKWQILRMVRGCGMRQMVVASFGALKQVDDQFMLDMKAKGVICSSCYAFTELWEHWDGDRVPQLTLPVGLRKMEAYGIHNAIIEANFACRRTDWSRLGEDGFFDFIRERCLWVQRHLSLPGRLRPAATFINIRDFNTAMAEAPGRVLRVVRRLGGLEPSVRPLGLMMEDPSGGKLPFQLSPWVASVRQAMDESGWGCGYFLAHVHHNYGLAQAAALECLASGCDGVWAALCDEGAATGHAGSLGTLVNLARLGNPHVRQQYDLVRMRDSAVRLTRLVTGAEPHPRTEVYGQRAAVDGGWWTEEGLGGGSASQLDASGPEPRSGEGGSSSGQDSGFTVEGPCLTDLQAVPTGSGGGNAPQP